MALQPFVVTYRCPVPRCGEEMLLPLDAPSEQAAWGPPGPHCFRHKMVSGGGPPVLVPGRGVSGAPTNSGRSAR